MRSTITACGDALLIKRFPPDYDVEPLKEFIGTGEARCVNLETVITAGDVFASTFCGGQWICSRPEVLDDLTRLGFNLYGCANNHSMDFSYKGVLDTYKNLKGRDLLFTGIGKSLDEAAAPVYLQNRNDKGEKVTYAMVSFTTTFIDAARAGNGNDDFEDRPGVNGVRHRDVYYVSHEEMETLKNIAAKTYINGERDNARRIGSLPPEAEGSFNFGGGFFLENDFPGKLTTTNEADELRVLDAVREAADKADFVVVLGHSHQIKHGSYTEPDYFCEDLYRKCIDAGADVIFGCGTHQLKPIEMYHGRPIFYSLGNFIFHNHLVERLPDDFWDKYGYDRGLSMEECLEIKSRNGTVGLELDHDNYLTVIPRIIFHDGEVESVAMLPVELNFDNENKGLPAEADQKCAGRIFDILTEISRDYGTHFTMKDGLILIDL